MDSSEIERIEKITFLLRSLLLNFRNSTCFTNNKQIYRSMIPNIEMVIAITEKGLYEDRAINNNEVFWFQNGRYIEDAFNLREYPEYKKVYEYYAEIVEFVNEYNFFRNSN
jgi:ribosomal protein L30/L7E